MFSYNWYVMFGVWNFDIRIARARRGGRVKTRKQKNGIQAWRRRAASYFYIINDCVDSPMKSHYSLLENANRHGADPPYSGPIKKHKKVDGNKSRRRCRRHRHRHPHTVVVDQVKTLVVLTLFPVTSVNKVRRSKQKHANSCMYVYV